MKTRNFFSQSGQSLVLIALMLVLFLGMLAVVLDGGYGYYQRRIAQNAADAGALAAASVLCETGDWGQAAAAGIQYAVDENGADSAVVTQLDERLVQVDTAITFDSFFGAVLGRPTITTGASAVSGCYAPGSGLGVLPIAWSCRPPIGGSDSEDCAIRFMQAGEDCTPLSDNMYVIVDSATIEEETLCQDPPNSGLPAGAVDCDVDDDYENDLEPLSGGNRAWLDLNGGGGGADDLSAWVRGGFPTDIDVHYWFAGQTGVTTKVYNTVADYQTGNDVIIPVFDQFCPSGVPNINCPGLMHPEDTIIVSGGSSTDYFHVISFAIFHITCVEAGSHGPCPGNDALGMDPNVKTIEGCFVTGYTPGGGGGPNDNPWAGAWTVYIIE